MKWMLIIFALCVVAVPAIGDTLEAVSPGAESNSKSDVNNSLSPSPEFIQATFVLNTLISELDEIAKKYDLVMPQVASDDQNVDERADFTRLMDLFLGETTKGESKTTFLKELMYFTPSGVANGSDGTSLSFGPSHIIDAVTTLFYIEASIYDQNQDEFIENVAYLNSLIPDLKREADPEFVNVVRTAISEWAHVF